MWDGEPPSSSSSEDEAAAAGAAKVKKPKKELGLRKRLELRFGRKGSDEKKEKEKDKAQETSPPPKGGEEKIEPWRSNSYRAEPRVLHGMRLSPDCADHCTKSRSREAAN